MSNNNFLENQIKLSNSLHMTQELQQSIKLLQLSSIELNEYINQQLEINPFLEIEEVKNSSLLNYPDYKSFPKSSSENFNKLDKDYLINNYAENNLSLKSYIIEQINYSIKSFIEREIALNLCNIIDEDGYLDEFEFNSWIKENKYDEGQINQVISILQRFEPAGIFARNIIESIIIQFKHKKIYNEKVEILLKNLELIKNGKESIIQRKYNISKAEIYKFISELKLINTRPGNIFKSENTRFIEPDIFLTYCEKTGYEIELNDKFAKSLYFNSEYYKSVKDKISLKKEKKYLSEQHYLANHLIKAIEQRSNTLFNVTKLILEKQQKFFESGIMYLRPLTLREIAQELDIHESTVSRITTNKYIMTQKGIFELKYFFSSSISDKYNVTSSSSNSVKYIIKNLVENEEEKILSDHQITETLNKLNIDIARRTVAKYRESMNIPTSAIRKRKKKLDKILY